MAEVRWTTNPGRDNWGRNGNFAARGLSALDYGPTYVVLQGITSRGDVSGAADLIVPKDQIPAVIAILESLR